MSDPNRIVVDRIAAELATVRWPEPEEIRARARRRSIRTMIVAPALLALALTGVWGVVADHPDKLVRPLPGTPTGVAGATVHPFSVPSTNATAPTPLAAAASPTSVRPGDPAWIRPEALLQPADLGTGFQRYDEDTYEPGEYPTWTFNLDVCPGFRDLAVTAHRRYRYLRIGVVAKGVERRDGQDAHQEVVRYSRADARQVVADVRRVVKLCAYYIGMTEAPAGNRPATVTVHGWTIRDEGFAGDESILVRQEVVLREKASGRQLSEPVRQLYSVVRVSDLVAVVRSDDYSDARLREITRLAASRLCAEAASRC